MDASQITDTKEAIRKKLKRQGLDDDQVQIQLNQLDCEFLTHAFVNGLFNDKSTQEYRLKFYYDFLNRNA